MKEFLNIKEMYFYKFYEKFHIRKKFFKPVEDLVYEVKEVRKLSNDLVICPQNTNYSWMGVLSVTKSLFPLNTVYFPQYYSTTIYNDKELGYLSDEISKIGFRNVIFSGFPLYFKKLLIPISKFSKTHVLYHGFLSELSLNQNQIEILNTIFELSKLGIIFSIAFYKKGLADTFSKLKQVNTKQILVKATEYELSSIKLSSLDGKLHLGVLGNNHFRKNIHNQLAGSLMVDNSIVHCSEINGIEYLNGLDRIQFNPSYMPHSEYLKLLGSMDVNSYVSFSESWGQIIPESLMMGVPCLAANTASIFDFDQELADWLIVKEFDNSAAIADQIKRVMPYREEIGRKGREYVLRLNKIADEKIRDWLDD